MPTINQPTATTAEITTPVCTACPARDDDSAAACCVCVGAGAGVAGADGRGDGVVAGGTGVGLGALARAPSGIRQTGLFIPSEPTSKNAPSGVSVMDSPARMAGNAIVWSARPPSASRIRAVRLLRTATRPSGRNVPSLIDAGAEPTAVKTLTPPVDNVGGP